MESTIVMIVCHILRIRVEGGGVLGDGRSIKEGKYWVKWFRTLFHVYLRNVSLLSLEIVLENVCLQRTEDVCTA